MPAFENARAFEDAARRCALSTWLLADIGLVEEADRLAIQRSRRARSAARRLGVSGPNPAV